MPEIDYKIPKECEEYKEWSIFVTSKISSIMENAISNKKNKILIHTNLKELPLENINKVAGPFVEAWALEKFEIISEEPNNIYKLINVEPGVYVVKGFGQQ